MSTPNTKHYTVAHPVPRDPEQYSKTGHFLKREKYRTPEIKPWVVEELLQEGEVRGTDTDGRFVFEKDVWSEGKHEWVLVVDLQEEAFLEADAQHHLVTAYCQCCPKEDDLP